MESSGHGEETGTQLLKKNVEEGEEEEREEEEREDAPAGRRAASLATVTLSVPHVPTSWAETSVTLHE